MNTSTAILHSIKVASLRSGLKPHLIRSWESRYGAVRPKRTQTNRRLYSDRDIERLRLLGRAVNNGHAISSVAGLDNPELARLVSTFNHEVTLPSRNGTEDRKAMPVDFQNLHGLVESGIDLIHQLDGEKLEQLISQAAVMLPRHQFLQELLLPIYRNIGDLWAEGELKIVHEHMFSAIVRSILWNMLKSVVVTPTAPKMVIATPSGHWHECGALISAVAVAESGWRVVYAGPSLPAEEIAYAVRQAEARALTLSIGHRINDFKISVELKNIRRYLGLEIPIFVGGSGSSAAASLLREINAYQTDDLREFRNKVEALGQHDLVGGYEFSQ